MCSFSECKIMKDFNDGGVDVTESFVQKINVSGGIERGGGHRVVLSTIPFRLNYQLTFTNFLETPSEVSKSTSSVSETHRLSYIFAKKIQPIIQKTFSQYKLPLYS
jgi:hypothetical protein